MSINTKHLSLLALIVLVGLGLRVYQLGSNPVSTYWDETAIGYDAYSVSQTGKDMHGNPWWQAIYPSYGDYKLPVYIWLAALSVKIFGPTVFAVRLVSALAGTGLIIVLYLISRQLFKKEEIAYATTLFVAISPWSLQFSRAAFEANLGVFFVGLTFLFLLQGRRQPWWMIAAAVSGALGVYSYFSVRVIVPFLLLGMFVFFRKDYPRGGWKYFLSSLLLFGLLILPISRSPLYPASNQFRLSTPSLLNTDDHILLSNEYRSWNNHSLVSRLIFHRSVFLGLRFLQNLSAYFSPDYLFFSGDQNLRHGTGTVGVMYWASIPFFITGILVSLRKKAWVALFLLGFWLVSLIPAAVPLTPPHSLRSLQALIPTTLFLGYGAAWWLSRPRLKKYGLALGFFLCLSMVFYLHDYWAHYPARSAYEWQYGYRQLTEYLTSQKEQYDYIWLDTSDGRMFLYTLWYEPMDPKIAQTATAKDFHFDDFEKYHFTEMNDFSLQQAPINSLIVMEPGDYRQLALPPPVKHTLYDYQGTEQFFIIDREDYVQE